MSDEQELTPEQSEALAETLRQEEDTLLTEIDAAQEPAVSVFTTTSDQEIITYEPNLAFVEIDEAEQDAQEEYEAAFLDAPEDPDLEAMVLSEVDAAIFAKALAATEIKHEDTADVVTHVTVEEEAAEEAEEVRSNAFGTQDFCPKKEKCDHRSADYCKQAKLEADHRAGCNKGHLCDCFSQSRGIPQPFRGGR